MRRPQLWSLLRTAATGWWNDRAMSMGAAIAFYAAFSMAPMLLLVIAVAGLVFGTEAAEGAVVGQVAALVGPDGRTALQAMLGSAREREGGIVGALVGATTFLFLATGALVELQDALNRIWKARPRVRSGIVGFLRTRVLSFALIVAIGFLLLVSLAVDAALTAFGDYLAMRFPGLPSLLAALDLVLSLAAAVFVLALVYKALPDVALAWRDVAFGAVVTAVLLALGKFVIGAYLGASDLASGFGAAAALMAMLLWIYYSALIALFGAELTKAYAERHGSRSGRPGSGTRAR